MAPFIPSPLGGPMLRPADATVTYLSPKPVAVMWGTSHDKVMSFIRMGELEAFNVASQTTGRPRFRMTLAVVKAFEKRRSCRDPARVPKLTHRRAPRAASPLSVKKYF